MVLVEEGRATREGHWAAMDDLRASRVAVRGSDTCCVGGVLRQRGSSTGQNGGILIIIGTHGRDGYSTKYCYCTQWQNQPTNTAHLLTSPLAPSAVLRTVMLTSFVILLAGWTSVLPFIGNSIEF